MASVVALPRRRRAGAGFTLVEATLIVAAIGVLAAVAVPTLVTLASQARTSEAVGKLAAIYRASGLYFATERAPVAAGAISGGAHAFPPPAPLTPSTVPAGVRVTDPPGTWRAATWQALGFSIADAHYYSYAYESVGTNAEAAFSARAIGDLDGNGVYSTFERSARVNAQLQIESPQGLWVNHETE